MDHHGDLLLGVCFTEQLWVREPHHFPLRILVSSLSDEPPRRRWTEVDGDGKGYGPDPLESERNLPTFVAFDVECRLDDARRQEDTDTWIRRVTLQGGVSESPPHVVAQAKNKPKKEQETVEGITHPNTC